MNIKLLIRSMIRRDMAEVMEIEYASFSEPWASGSGMANPPENSFVRYLRKRNCLALVAEHNNHVVGYMVFRLCSSRIEILRFAVHPSFRRHKIGSCLIANMQAKLSTRFRKWLVIYVDETLLPMQLLLRSCGLRATAVVNGAIRFVYGHISETARTGIRKQTASNL